MEYYNHKSYHESPQNLIRVKINYGRGEIILQEKKRIKMEPIKQRRFNIRKNKNSQILHRKKEIIHSLMYETFLKEKSNLFEDIHYYLPEQLVEAIGEFVAYYNHERYHDSLINVTPADMYYGRQEQILKQREIIKKKSLKRRRQLFLKEKQLFLNNETLYNQKFTLVGRRTLAN